MNDGPPVCVHLNTIIVLADVRDVEGERAMDEGYVCCAHALLRLWSLGRVVGDRFALAVRTGRRAARRRAAAEGQHARCWHWRRFQRNVPPRGRCGTCAGGRRFGGEVKEWWVVVVVGMSDGEIDKGVEWMMM